LLWGERERERRGFKKKMSTPVVFLERQNSLPRIKTSIHGGAESIPLLPRTPSRGGHGKNTVTKFIVPSLAGALWRFAIEILPPLPPKSILLPHAHQKASVQVTD
jgi:hypothetical protein